MYNCTNKWRITRKTNFSGESLARRIRDQLIHIFCQSTHTGMRLGWGGRLTKFMLLICFLVSITRQRLSQSLEASAFVLSHRQGNLPKLGQLGGGKVSRDNLTSQPSHKEKLEHSRWQIATLALCENQWDFLFRIHYDHHYAHLDLWSFGACSLVHLLNFPKEQAPPHTSHEGFSPQELP